MTSKSEEPADWQAYSKADSKVLAEIIRQGELRLQAQLQSALAADARAGFLASMQATGAAAFVVYALGKDHLASAFWPSMAAALTLFIGAVFAAWAAQPVAFGFVGNRPCQWLEQLETETIDTALAGTAVWCDKYLDQNDKCMKSNALWARLSIVALVATPIVAGLALFIHP